MLIRLGIGGDMSITALEFARMVVRLWPAGRYRTDPDGNIFKSSHAIGDELARLQQRQIDLLEESDPRTTSELLPEWEEQHGLTDSSGTDDERQARLETRILSLFGFSTRPEDYQSVLAPVLDLEVAQIQVIEITAADAALVGQPRDVYKFYIYRDPLLPGTPDLVFAQSEVDRIKHSHTLGFVIESIDFLCDDPFSLCDRDLLGV